MMKWWSILIGNTKTAIITAQTLMTMEWNHNTVWTINLSIISDLKSSQLRSGLINKHSQIIDIHNIIMTRT